MARGLGLAVCSGPVCVEVGMDADEEDDEDLVDDTTPLSLPVQADRKAVAVRVVRAIRISRDSIADLLAPEGGRREIARARGAPSRNAGTASFFGGDPWAAAPGACQRGHALPLPCPNLKGVEQGNQFLDEGFGDDTIPQRI